MPLQPHITHTKTTSGDIVDLPLKIEGLYPSKSSFMSTTPENFQSHERRDEVVTKKYRSCAVLSMFLSILNPDLPLTEAARSDGHRFRWLTLAACCNAIADDTSDIVDATRLSNGAMGPK